MKITRNKWASILSHGDAASESLSPPCVEEAGTPPPHFITEGSRRVSALCMDKSQNAFLLYKKKGKGFGEASGRDKTNEVLLSGHLR